MGMFIRIVGSAIGGALFLGGLFLLAILAGYGLHNLEIF